MKIEQPEPNPERLDRKAEVPDLIPYLLPDERVVKIQRFDTKVPEENPVALKALLSLANVEKTKDVGLRGPVVAAQASKENKDIKEFKLFEALFGRDSLRVATDLRDRFPELTKSTLLRLAELQGTKNENLSEEEPGRIIHEYRTDDDPVAQEISRRKNWRWPYYGSVDATPMFISGVSKFTLEKQPGFLEKNINNRNGEPITVGIALDNSLNWLEKRMSQNSDGFLEFKKANHSGIDNQVWKDSWDSYFHKDGMIANHENGIASIEVQALVYDSLLDAADLYEKQGSNERAKNLKEKAETLKKNIMEKFWVENENGGYFALGTDRDEAGNLRRLEIKTSNMGHVLNSRLLEGGDPEIIRRREAIIKNLFSENMLAASGIRTLAKDEKRFRPGAYHNGNVWLWDNYIIAEGLRRQGYPKLARELMRRIFSVVKKFRKFPEFARGGEEKEPVLNSRVVDLWDDKQNRINHIEQPPQDIQAWSVSAILAEKYRCGEEILHPKRYQSKQKLDANKKLEDNILSSISNTSGY